MNLLNLTKIGLICLIAATSMSFSAPQSRAATIFSDDTRTIPTLPYSHYYWRWQNFAPSRALHLDINSDGRRDISIWRTERVYGAGTLSQLWMTPSASTRAGAEDRFRRALAEGGTVDQTTRLYSNRRGLLNSLYVPERCHGNSCTPERTIQYQSDLQRVAADNFTAFLGLSLNTSTNWRLNQYRQFGWLQLDLDAQGRGTVSAFGYESTPNTPSVIGAGRPAPVSVVPLPASGWAMLLGFAGLALFRRRTRA